MNYISPNEIEELINRKRLIVYRKSYIYDITDLLKSHPGGKANYHDENGINVGEGNGDLNY